MGRRKFAKNSQDVRHFRLVSRSQNDAYADAPGAGELVLEPLVKPGDSKRTGLSEAELALVPEGLAAKHPEAFADINALQRALPDSDEESDDDEEKDPEAALEGDCYFPQDGYNYEQHLKKVSGSKGSQSAGVVISAPKVVDERAIKKQAAETTEEADILRALEFVDEYEEIEGDLEEILPGGALDVGSVLWGPAAAEDADLPDLAVFKAMHAARLAMAAEGAEGEEDDECFEGTGPARGSRAPGTAPQADAEAAAEFDDFFAAEYGEEDDVGACSEEEIEGELELDESLLDEYLEGKKAEVQELNSLYEPVKGKLDDVPRVIEETKAIIARHYCEEAGEDTSSGEESEDESKNWDCETVLSTLSNVSNRPGKIGKIKVIKKPAMKSVQEDNDDSEDEDDDEEAVELPDVVTDRPKNETPEEKKARKAGVKAMRKICRQMKKESKTTYKEEAEKMKDRQTRAGDIRAKARTFRL